MDYDEFGNYIGSEQPIEASDSETASENEEVDEVVNLNAIVLPENKVYHPSPQQVFPEVEIIHAEEDSQDITVPLIKPVLNLPEEVEQGVPEARYSRKFQRELQKSGNHSRVVAVIGAQGHGKSAFVDALVEKTHKIPEGAPGDYHFFTDTDEFEIGRKLSVFTSPVSLLLPDSRSKSYVIHFLDTPGHSDFIDEAEYALSLADSALILVDVVEGVLPATRRLLSRASAHQLPVTLVFTKIDRLIVDLRLPPTECYHRLDYILDEVSDAMVRAGGKTFDPTDILFTSAEHRWCFDLSHFAHMYPNTKPQHLWGDIFFENGRFVPKGTHWSFAELVLTPLYKLYSACMGSDEALAELLEGYNIEFKRRDLKLDYVPRLRVVLNSFLEWGSLVDKVTKHPFQNRTVLGKNFLSSGKVFALMRTGETLSIGDRLNGQQIREIWLPQGKYRIATEILYPGELALLDITVAPLRQISEPAVKIGIEPLIPAELPQVLDVVARALKVLPGLHAESQDSGEHVLFGPGEMFFDFVMFFMRKLLGSVELKVSDPSVRFRETCAEQSFVSCSTTLPGDGKITFLAVPISDDLSKELQPIPKTLPTLKPVLKSHGWDNMAIRSLWTFGPDSGHGTSVLVNDVLGENRKSAEECRDEITDGFLLSTQQGPLCDEHIHNVQFKLIEFNCGKASSGQIVATARRACYSAFLVASPRLLEPWYEIMIIGPLLAGRSIYENLRRRRGKVLDDRPIPGTNLYKIEGKVPVLDSFGLETDIRVATKGQTKVSLVFSHLAVVPGDPLDESVKLDPLDIAVAGQLARNFVLKTRKRKALAPEPSLAKYLDADVAQVLGIS